MAAEKLQPMPLSSYTNQTEIAVRFVTRDTMRVVNLFNQCVIKWNGSIGWRATGTFGQWRNIKCDAAWVWHESADALYVIEHNLMDLTDPQGQHATFTVTTMGRDGVRKGGHVVQTHPIQYRCRRKRCVMIGGLLHIIQPGNDRSYELVHTCIDVEKWDAVFARVQSFDTMLSFPMRNPHGLNPSFVFVADLCQKFPFYIQYTLTLYDLLRPPTWSSEFAIYVSESFPL